MKVKIYLSGKIHQLPDSAGFEPARPAKRDLYRQPKLNGPSKLMLPMGIEPTSPGLFPGVLTQLNYGAVRITDSVGTERLPMLLAKHNENRCASKVDGQVT